MASGTPSAPCLQAAMLIYSDKSIHSCLLVYIYKHLCTDLEAEGLLYSRKIEIANFTLFSAQS